MTRDRLLRALQRFPVGATLASLVADLQIDAHCDEASAVEALLYLSPEVRQIDGAWRLVDMGHRERILASIEVYASSSGKKVFRAAAALEGLPLKDQPTLEELRDVLASSGGRFTLLSNAMIKRND